MKILTISGSARKDSTNRSLLDALPDFFAQHKFLYFHIADLPLFTDQGGDADNLDIVKKWRSAITTTDSLIISTPEYIHNIPAALKNALEWVYASGELANKRVIPIVYTPLPPRGEKAMQSLLFSLTALEANVVTSLNLYQSEIKVHSGIIEAEEEIIELLLSAIELL